MGLWRPTKDGKVECTKHGEVFPKGTGVCAMCNIDQPTEKELAASTAKPPPRRRRGKLPSTADHEAAFVVIADLMEQWARDEDQDARNWVPPAGEVKVIGGPSRGTAAKLMDCAIKARRAACALAQWREDWVNTERLEKAARDLARRREKREAAPAEVRH